MPAHSPSSLPEPTSRPFGEQAAARSFFTPGISTWLKPLSPVGRSWYERLIEVEPWSLFAAATFREWCSPERAEDAARWWLRQVARQALGAREGRRRELPSVALIERKHDSHHAHFLVAGCDGLTDDDLDELRAGWVSHYGSSHGMKLERFNYEEGGQRYVLKDVLKKENSIVIPSLEIRERLTNLS
jgi:hypothetical protein